MTGVITIAQHGREGFEGPGGESGTALAAGFTRNTDG
jgi:hypothetical protein